MSFQVLIIVDLNQKGFVPVKEFFGQQAVWCSFADFARRTLASDDSMADLILVCQSRPGEFDADFISQIQRTYPWTPLWVIQSEWCGKKKLANEFATGVFYEYLHHFKHLANSHFEKLEDETVVPIADSPLFSIPQTANRHDIELLIGAFEGGNLPRDSVEHSNARIGIVADSFESRDSLKIAIDSCELQSFGLQVCEIELNTSSESDVVWNLDLLLVDFARFDMFTREQTAQIKKRFPNAKLIAISNFLRATEQSHLSGLGYHASLTKPYRLSYLSSAIRSLLESQANHGQAKDEIVR